MFLTLFSSANGLLDVLNYVFMFFHKCDRLAVWSWNIGGFKALDAVAVESAMSVTNRALPDSFQFKVLQI